MPTLDEIRSEIEAEKRAPMNLGRYYDLREQEQEAARSGVMPDAAIDAFERPLDPETDPILARLNSGHVEPGAGAAFTRGVAKRAAELTAPIAEAAYRMSPFAGPVAGELELDSTGFGAQVGSEIADRPLTRHGQGMEMAGEFAAEAAPFAPLAAAGAPAYGVNPAVGVLAEMGAAGLGGYLYGRSGEHPAALAGAAALGVAVPTGLNAVPRVAGKLRGVGARMTPEAKALARELDVSPSAAVRTSEDLKRDVPFVDEYTEALRRAEELGDKYDVSPSSRQVADAMPDGAGGGGLAHLEERVSRDRDFAREAARRRTLGIRSLDDEWRGLGAMGDASEGGDYGRFLEHFDEIAANRKSSERMAWAAVPMDERPMIDVSRVLAKVGRQRDTARTIRQRGVIPSEFDDLENLSANGEIALSDLQQIRSQILAVFREHKLSPTANSGEVTKFLKPVLDDIGDAVSAWEKADISGASDAYKAARAATVQNKELFDLNSPVIRVLDQGGQERNLFRTIRTAKGKRGSRTSPVSEARRVMRILEQSPARDEAVSNLRRLAIDDLFTDGFNPTATRTPLKTMRRSEGVYREILGDDYDRAVELLELTRMQTTGKAGTSAQAISVGSGVSPINAVLSRARGEAFPISDSVPAAGPMRTVLGVIKKTVTAKDEMMMQKIARKALEEPRYMRVLMEMPTDAELPRWAIEWHQLLAAASKSGGRSGARAALRAAEPDTQ